MLRQLLQLLTSGHRRMGMTSILASTLQNLTGLLPDYRRHLHLFCHSAGNASIELINLFNTIKHLLHRVTSGFGLMFMLQHIVLILLVLLLDLLHHQLQLLNHPFDFTG